MTVKIRLAPSVRGDAQMSEDATNELGSAEG
jgi:hypothetical protein